MTAAQPLFSNHYTYTHSRIIRGRSVLQRLASSLRFFSSHEATVVEFHIYRDMIWECFIIISETVMAYSCCSISLPQAKMFKLASVVPTRCFAPCSPVLVIESLVVFCSTHPFRIKIFLTRLCLLLQGKQVHIRKPALSAPEVAPERKRSMPINPANTIRKCLSNNAVSQRPFRDRIVHLLALRSYKKLEVLARLQRDGINQKDRNSLGTTLQQVSVETKITQRCLFPLLLDRTSVFLRVCFYVCVYVS